MKEEKRNIIYKYKIPALNKHGQVKIEAEGWDFEKALFFITFFHIDIT